MAKTNTPFFSLGSRGTIADSLTSQKIGSATLLRQKPIPADPYSLPQAYQRWLYEDYAYLWTQQSEATRRAYATAGSRYHLTGFQNWMKYQLTNLPDIAGMWHLDEKSGALAIDFSRNANHGVIIGATPADGVIDGAYLGDGLNDYINCGNSPSLNPIEGSIELFLKLSSWPAATKHPITRRNAYVLYLFSPARLRWYSNIDGVGFEAISGSYLPPSLDTWYHVLLSYDTALGGLLYVDGIQRGVRTGSTGNLSSSAFPSILFWHTNYPGARFFHGLEDHVIIYNRPLDHTEALRHSARRYPS